MELRPVVGADVEAWYRKDLTEAFPPCERKPLEDIRALIADGRYEILGLYAGAAGRVGFATLWSHPDWPGYGMLDYLGVDASRRGGGLGGQILDLVRERCRGKQVLVLEAELPVPGAPEEENALRQRRLAFYGRSGCTPVYDTFACGLRCRAFVLGELPERLTDLKQAHRAIYGPRRDDVVIDPPPDAVPTPPYWMEE